MPFISALLFGFSANIDTFVLGFSYGMKKQRISLTTNLILSFITFFGTLLSIGIGTAISSFVPQSTSQITGSLLLILLGLYYCSKYLIPRILPPKEKGSIHAASLQMESQSIQDVSIPSVSSLTRRETATLGLALTINNAGMGIGASFAGIHLTLTSIVTLVLSALFLSAGNRLGCRLVSSFIQRCADLFSGLIILMLGIYELVSF